MVAFHNLCTLIENGANARHITCKQRTSTCLRLTNRNGYQVDVYPIAKRACWLAENKWARWFDVDRLLNAVRDYTGPKAPKEIA